MEFLPLFDFDKTRWFNQQYLRNKSSVDIAIDLQKILISNKLDFDKKYVERVCDQLKERAIFISDMWSEGQYYFKRPASYDKKVIDKKWKEETSNHILALKDDLMLLDSFREKDIEKMFKIFLEKKQLKMGTLLPVFRLAITGIGMGPSVFGISELLGKKEVVLRMSNAVKKIKNGAN